MSEALRTSLRARLLANTDLSAMVGGSRVYPVHLPQAATYPAVTYQKISDVTEPNLGEASRIRTARIQLDTWADTPADAWKLADHIRTQVDGFQGTVSGVRFAASMVDSETDLYEEAIEKFRVTVDYEIVYWPA